MESYTLHAMTDEVKPTFYVKPKPEDLNKKIRPIYAQLQACLTYSPNKGKIFDHELWNNYHLLIDELNSITRLDYSKFRLKINDSDRSWSHVDTDQYKTKLASLIRKLHAEYFINEQVPFTDGLLAPSMVIHNQNSQNQSQQQTQEQKIEVEQLLLNAQQMIQAEYGKEKADEAIELIKKIIVNPNNWAIIASAISGLLTIGKVAFTAALPILGKILLGTIPVQNA
jgi:hypothetical protein